MSSDNGRLGGTCHPRYIVSPVCWPAKQDVPPQTISEAVAAVVLSTRMSNVRDAVGGKDGIG